MAVRRTRAVLFATVALAALAISPAAQAIDGFENIGAGYFSPSASILGISGDGRVVFDNGFVGYSPGWTYANGAYAWVPVLHPGYATIITRSYRQGRRALCVVNFTIGPVSAC